MQQRGLKRDANPISAMVGMACSDAISDAACNQLLVNLATQPVAEVDFRLKPLSVKLRVVEHQTLIGERRAALGGGPARYQMFCIGEAVAARNIHMATDEALRVV